jgi:hypothetical protein
VFAPQPDPKISDPLGRYCMAVFTGGVNIGPYEAARHIAGVSFAAFELAKGLGSPNRLNVRCGSLAGPPPRQWTARSCPSQYGRAARLPGTASLDASLCVMAALVAVFRSGRGLLVEPVEDPFAAGSAAGSCQHRHATRCASATVRNPPAGIAGRRATRVSA